MFNLFSGLGFVGADARVNDARTRAMFQIAIQPPRRKTESSEERKPYWIPCAVFGDRVPFAEKHVRTGAQILVVGALTTYEYLPEESDTPLVRLEVHVEKIEVVRPSRRGAGSREVDEFDQR